MKASNVIKIAMKEVNWTEFKVKSANEMQSVREAEYEINLSNTFRSVLLWKFPIS